MNENLTIKVTNHLTGEISEIEIKGGDHAANVLQNLTASQKALGNAIDSLKAYINDFMGEDEKAQVGNYMVQRMQRETRNWTPSGLRSVGFDQDAIEVALKVNMTVARQLVEEAIERGEIAPDSKKVLTESAEVQVSKPFLTFKEIK
jgi:hypothetical protein